MGYTRAKFRQCNENDWIATIPGEKKPEEIVKICNDIPECTGIYSQNCRSKRENKILCKGEPEEVTKENGNACVWIRSKYKCTK